MEERIKLYLDTFPDIDREQVIKMIESFDKAIEERILFCQKLDVRVAKRKAEYEMKMNPQTKRK